MRGINADGVKENVFAHAVAQLLLHLEKARGFERACVHAMGIDEVDYYALALEQIVVKADFDTILRDQRYIGKIVRAPAGVIGRCGLRAC